MDYASRCINEHKDKCTEQVITGRCNNKKCKKGHPIVCRNIENGRICKRDGYGCLYLHPNRYNEQDRRYKDYGIGTFTMGNQMEMILEIEIIGMDIITDMEIMWNIIWETIGKNRITIIWGI